MMAAEATDRLFFALIPDKKTVEAICGTRRQLREATGVSGTEVLPEHLHVTLWHVGDAAEPPPAEIIDALIERASQVDLPSFRVSFTRAKSLGKGAFVLYGGKGVADLKTLSTRLRDVLNKPGTDKREPFMPHMTLLRSKTLVPPREVNPVTWMAREIVLVHSLLGKTTHRHVGRLPLRPGAQLWLPGFDF